MTLSRWLAALNVSKWWKFKQTRVNGGSSHDPLQVASSECLKVMEISKQTRVNGGSSHDPLQVASSECPKWWKFKQTRVNGCSNYDFLKVASSEGLKVVKIQTNASTRVCLKFHHFDIQSWLPWESHSYCHRLLAFVWNFTTLRPSELATLRKS